MKPAIWPIKRSEWETKLPASGNGERIYAIGDVHGRIDLLQLLLERLERDIQQRGNRPTRLVFLGDLIDRGPYSKQVLELVRQALHYSDWVVAILGNHEELLLASAAGHAGAQRVWARNGGDATLRSFGLNPGTMEKSAEQIADTLREVVGEGVLSWLESLPLTFASGDYFFCHAGIRPGVRLLKQKRQDLIWIRNEFLDSSVEHDAMIVHGHSEVDQELSNQIVYVSIPRPIELAY